MKGNTILLCIILLLLCGSIFLSYSNAKQITLLRHENNNLLLKIDSVEQILSNKPQQDNLETENSSSTGNILLDFLFEKTRERQEEVENAKVIVSSKYRLEDRYVSYKIKDPEIIGEEEGNVIIRILVDIYGSVVSARLESSNGITNAEVIEACKKAALKTDFNYNSNIREDQSGSIIYIFTKK